MHIKPKLIAALAAVSFTVACGGALGIGDGIASFGSAFLAMFNAGVSAQPVDAQSIDLAVNFTANPFNP